MLINNTAQQTNIINYNVTRLLMFKNLIVIKKYLCKLLIQIWHKIAWMHGSDTATATSEPFLKATHLMVIFKRKMVGVS